MNTGRINPFFIVKALQEGADGVLVSGCDPGECHYLTGNLSARRKFALLKNFLSYIGVIADLAEGFELSTHPRDGRGPVALRRSCRLVCMG